MTKERIWNVKKKLLQNGEIIENLGSGLNYNKKGLKRLIRLIVDSKVERLVSDAWKRCFKKIAKPPKLKKKGKQDSFTLDGSPKVAHQKIKVPGIGWLKTYERLPHGCQPKSVTISQKANRWFISFKIEIEQQTTDKTYDVVGWDLGFKSLATLSTGEIFEGAKSSHKYEKKLSRLQYLNRHKIKGSSNWKKAQKSIAKLHFKIANIPKDTLHKLTNYLAKNHGSIVIEDLY